MAAAQCIDTSSSCLNQFSGQDLVFNYKMLKPLDEALRCRICFEYFNNCLMTKCNHNYCSICIRRYMTYKSQCPTCFQDAAEPELQNNRLVDEILRLYKKFRGLNDEKVPHSLKTPDLPVCSAYVIETSSDSCSSMLSQTTSTSTDEPFTPRVKIEIPEDKSMTFDHISSSVKKEPDFNEVSCPVCYNPVLALTINAHLDSCLKQQFDESGRRKTLPKLVYHLLTDKEIKTRLREHGLHVTGDRSALIRRHKNFVTLYNANCDALKPKPVSELVKEVELQEIEERINSLPKEIQVNKKSDLSLIEHQHQSYIKKHQSQFNSLISDVQQRQIARMHIKKENEESINKGQECVPDKTTSDSGSNRSIKLEDQSLSFTGNSKSIDNIDSSSLDDFDIQKRAVNLHHKRKKAVVSNQNQASPKKK